MPDKDKNIKDSSQYQDTTESIVPDENLHPDVIAALKLQQKTKPNPTEYTPAQEEQMLQDDTISTLY